MTQPESLYSRGFRPEIQALRAVAVGLVLAFHLTPKHVPGGYVGVDVFFVISGFLITGHLSAEALRTGRISLLAFWSRRIRRLLPAASVVLIVSFIAMLVILPRAVWQQTVTEIAASALYVQNWLLGANAVDYLAAENVPSVVQHFWSLSVEEQFYIAWPLLLTLAILVASRQRIRGALVVLLGVLFVGSLAFSVVLTLQSQPLAYFNTGTRAWEFAAGGLLALVPTAWFNRGERRFNATLRTVGSWVGLALIGFAALRFDESTAFPGYLATLPVVGTLLVIAGGGVVNRWSANSLAPFGPVQLVGDLSYGIYLWHWPLIVVAHAVLSHRPGWKASLAIVALSIALAWLMQRFIENPIRFGTFFSARRWRPFALGAVTIVALVAASVVTFQGVAVGVDRSRITALERLDTDPCFGAPALIESGKCTDPFAVPADFDSAFAANDHPHIYDGDCSESQPEWQLTICAYGELVDPAFTVVIVGNSHAEHFLPSLRRYGADKQWQVIAITRHACLGVTTVAVAQPTEQSCLDWSAHVQNWLHSNTKIDEVIFSTYVNVDHYIGPPDITDSQETALKVQIAGLYSSLLDEGKAVMVIGDTPESKKGPGPQCVDVHRRLDDPCFSSAKSFSPENIMTEAARETKGVLYVDPTPWLCDSDRCHLIIGGVSVYSDFHHLSATFATSLAPYVGAKVEEALHQRG